MAKAKSKKSCGLNPVCHINKAVDDMKASIKAGSSGRNKRIDAHTRGALRGDDQSGGTYGNPEGSS